MTTIVDRQVTKEISAGPRRRGSSMRPTYGLLILPSVVLLLLINGYPIVYAALQSVRNGNLINPGTFVGLTNYENVLSSSAFWNAVGFTLIFTLVGVFGSWLVGLGLAAAAAHHDPGTRILQGAAPAALGRPHRGLLHLLELAGRHGGQPAAQVHRRSRAGCTALPRRPDMGPDHGLRLQGVGELPVHDAHDQRGPGGRRRHDL
jgi:hypothetical protein